MSYAIYSTSGAAGRQSDLLGASYNVYQTIPGRAGIITWLRRLGRGTRQGLTNSHVCVPLLQLSIQMSCFRLMFLSKPAFFKGQLNNMKGMHLDPKVGVYFTMQKVAFLQTIIAFIALVKSKLKVLRFYMPE